MVSARDANVVKLFNSAELFTGQQVASYFSHLVSKHRIQGCDTQSYQEPDEESLEAEVMFTELREEVILNIQPTHAIMYDSYNLCELMNEGQLLKFTISMLEYVSSLKFQRLTSKAKEKPHTQVRLKSFWKNAAVATLTVLFRFKLLGSKVTFIKHSFLWQIQM